MNTTVDPGLPVESVPVVIKNWSDSPQPKATSRINRTTLQTYILDPAGTTMTQIAAYEPSRRRMVVQVVDAPVVILTERPSVSPDVSTATQAPMGRHLPAGAIEYPFYGPDEYWVNAITGAASTRVTVLKEYC